MVVKALKRKSVNTSGVWEVEAVPESPNQEENKKLKLDTPSKSEKKQIESSASPSKSKIQQNNGLLSPNQRNRNELTRNQLKKQEKNAQRIEQSNINDAQQEMKNGLEMKNGQEMKNELETKNELVIQSQAKEEILKWNSGDLLQLVVRLEEQNKHLFNRTYSEAVEEVDWSQISFGDHSAEECKSMWLVLFSKSRSIRQLVEEAREMLLRKKVVNVSTPNVSANTSQQSEFLNSSTASKDTSREDETPLSERSIRRTENSTADNEDNTNKDDDDEEEEEEEDDDDDEEEDDDDDAEEDDDDDAEEDDDNGDEDDDDKAE